MTRRIFFQESDSCRSLTADEIGFILDIIWEHDKKMKIALVFGEALWSIRLETQKYIDEISNLQGSSVSFPLVTPKITLLSLEEWTDRPEPKNVFYSQVAFRRFLLLREYHRAFRIPNSIFQSSMEGSVNNNLITGASASQWLVEGYKSSSHTRSGHHTRQPNSLLPPASHLHRGT